MPGRRARRVRRRKHLELICLPSSVHQRLAMATSSLFQRTLKHAFRQPTRPTPFFTPHAHRSARLHTLDTPRAALSSAALSPAAVKPSSVLHFLRTRILQATHRSSRPRGSQSSWEPPRPSSSWLQRTPGSTIVWGIAGLNGLVFIGWYIAKANYVSHWARF